MALILGIETSCDETAASVYDSAKKRLLSSAVFSQVPLHEKYGGVVPEIASRSHLEKIGFIVQEALDTAKVTLAEIDHIAVTNKPGLVGALLIGMCFAKGLAWANKKKLIGVDHLEGHIFSSFLDVNGDVVQEIPFPHLCLTVSGGHTSLFLVKNFGEYELVGQTLDDAAGEVFDKVAKLVGLGYPGGPKIEMLAKAVDFKDFFTYPRSKKMAKTFDFSFSGLKTAVLYDLVARGAYDLRLGIISNNVTLELQQQVASSLLVCVADIMKEKIRLALKTFPEVKGVTFVGGVACNSFLRRQLEECCLKLGKTFSVPPAKYCGDNAGMIAFVGGYKADQGNFSELTLDVYE